MDQAVHMTAAYVLTRRMLSTPFSLSTGAPRHHLAAIGGSWGRGQPSSTGSRKQEGASSGDRGSSKPLLQRLLPWSGSRARHQASPPPAVPQQGWWPPRLPALFRRGHWAVEELEEYEYVEEENERGWLPEMVLPRGEPLELKGDFV